MGRKDNRGHLKIKTAADPFDRPHRAVRLHLWNNARIVDGSSASWRRLTSLTVQSSARNAMSD